MPRNRKTESDHFRDPFPSRLRELLKKDTQQKLADYIGKTRQSVSYYSDGSTSPDLETLVKIAKYFSVSTDYLLGIQPVKSIDISIQKTHKETGLSEMSIKNLQDMNRAIVCFGRSPLDIVNALLEQCTTEIADEAGDCWNDLYTGEWRNNSVLSAIESYIFTASPQSNLFVTQSGKVVVKKEGQTIFDFAPDRVEQVESSEIVERVFLARIEYALKQLRNIVIGDADHGEHS